MKLKIGFSFRNFVELHGMNRKIGTRWKMSPFSGRHRRSESCSQKDCMGQND